jgi:hypothetical protein
MTEAEIEAQAHFMLNPDDYVRHIIGVEPEPYQVKILRDLAVPNARVCFVGANGIGKDALSSWAVEWFLYCFPDAVVPTTSASGRQVSLLWHEINYWTKRSSASERFEVLQQRMHLRDNPDAHALGFKAVNEATVEGFHRPKLLYIVTEGRGVEDWAYTAVLKACTDLDNRILVQSVPGLETGEFFKIASGMRRRGGWKVHQVPAAKKVSACPACQRPFPPDEVYCRTIIETKSGPKECGRSCYIPNSSRVTQASIDEKLQYGEQSSWFLGPVLAQFSKGSSLSLITLADFMDSVKRFEDFEDDDSYLDVLGVDLAWIGSAETVLCHRRGPKVINFIAYQGERTTETIRIVKEWMESHPGGLVVTEGGIAQSSLIDSLYDDKLDDRLVEVDPGSPGFEEEKFQDRRSELYFYLAERFKAGMIAIDPRYAGDGNNPSPLGGQLTTIQKEIRGDLKFQIESKKKMASRGVPSPDWGDSLMLTMAVAGEESVRDHRALRVTAIGNRTRPDW